jgi:hypothetical protein
MNGRKVQLGPGKKRRKLGLVWRIRTKISQIIKDYFYLPFFLLIILWKKRLDPWEHKSASQSHAQSAKTIEFLRVEKSKIYH